MSSTTKNTAAIVKISIVSFAALLVLAILLASNSKQFGLDASFVAKDELTGNLLPAARNYAELSAKYLLGFWFAFELLSYLFLLRSSGFKEAVEKNKINRVRWAAWGISGFVALFVIGAVAGIRNTEVLKLLGLLALGSGLLGWANDWVQTHDKQKHWLIYWMAAVSGVLPWLFLASHVILSWVYGMVKSPWYVLLSIAIGAVGALIIASFQFKTITSKTGKRKATNFEQNLLLNGFLVKCLIGLILIIGLRS